MSKDSKFYLSSFLTILISVTIITLLWNNISLPYKNSAEVIGVYSNNNHHHLNDTIRFIIFISIPLFVFILNCFFFQKKLLKNFLDIFQNKNNSSNTQNKDAIIFTISFLFLIVCFFLSKDFTFHKLDLFHEGQYLGGGFNFIKTGKLWSDNFIVTGLFVDVLLSPISWNIFDQVSIGSTRMFIDFLNLLTKFFLIFFFYNLIILINIEKYIRIICLIPFFIISIYLLNSNYINFRDIPIIISLSLIIILLVKRSDPFYFKVLILGILSPFSILLSIEKGLYLNFLYIFLLITFFLLKKYKWLFWFVIFIILSWISLYLIIGEEEFKLFIKNSIEIAKYTEALNGLIHPGPFSDMADSSRATKNLLILLINGIFLISLLYINNKRTSDNFKIFSILFFIESLVFYKTGLSRSDGGHLKQGIALGYIQFLSFLIFSFTIIIDKKIFINKYLKSLYFYTPIFFFILLLFNFLDFNNIKNFNNNLKKLITADDEFFLETSDKNFVNSSKNFLNASNCIQVFNYEPAMNYLLKKKSCTRYNLIFAVGSNYTQMNLINELNVKNTEYIIIGGRYDAWGIDPKIRYPYVYKYLNANYDLFNKIGNRTIIKKN